GSIRDLGDLGGGPSEARGLNGGATQIVGTAAVPSTSGLMVYHAFLWKSGAMLDLNDAIPPGSGWMLQEADGINDAGQIAGWGSLNGEVHGFLLQPAGSAAPVAVGAARGEPFQLRLASVSSSPIRTAATLRYELPAAGPATLLILDVGGRRVREI